jgi:predicted HTH transcriptional regulator
MEALCGMINSDNATGEVLFGVAPDGSICGIEPGNLDTAQITITQSLRKFDPPVTSSIEIFECEGKTIISLKGRRLEDAPWLNHLIICTRAGLSSTAILQ